MIHSKINDNDYSLLVRFISGLDLPNPLNRKQVLDLVQKGFLERKFLGVSLFDRNGKKRREYRVTTAGKRAAQMFGLEMRREMKLERARDLRIHKSRRANGTSRRRRTL